jgi:hypothetical protein
MLRGEFQGKDRILVDVVRDDEGKVRRLIFKGVNTEEEKAKAAAAAAELAEPVAG